MIRMCFVLPTLVPTTTFGLALPAKPAFNVAVPLSMTTGWLKRNELPVSSSPVASSDAIVMLYFTDLRYYKQEN